jgi:hypothetical protein
VSVDWLDTPTARTLPPTAPIVCVLHTITGSTDAQSVWLSQIPEEHGYRVASAFLLFASPFLEFLFSRCFFFFFAVPFVFVAVAGAVFGVAIANAASAKVQLLCRLLLLMLLA